MADYSNLNLGKPLNEASHTTIPGSHSTLGGSAPLNASAAPGDYNPSGADQGFARDVLNTLDNRTGHAGTGAGIGGQQQTVSGQYETTNPGSGLQRAGESEPHALRSGGHAHANFPAESDTLTSGEAGKFGSENDARRQEGLVGAATGHHHQSSHPHASGLTGGHTGPSSREMDQELNDPKRGLPDLVGHPVSSGYGLNKGHRGDETSHSHSGAGLAGAGAAGALGGAGLASAAHGQHGHSSQFDQSTAGNGGASGLEGGARPAHDSILNTNEKPKELEIGGFNPKTDIDPSVAKPSEVEHISTDGPHGLVFHNGKYVHRRELEGDTSREPSGDIKRQ